MNIQILKNGDNPSFARIIIVHLRWERDFSTAQSILTKICENWPEGNRVQFILTSSGFIDFEWAESDIEILDNWYPDSNYVMKLQSIAEKQCKLLINDELRAKLYSCAEYLSIGIDSEKFNKIQHPDCWPFYPHIEFVALINLKTNQYHWSGKSYPQKEQERGLIRNQVISNHFIDLPIGKTLILACHDLVMEYPRGIAATKEGSPRDKIRKEFELSLFLEKPLFVIHHAHTSNDSLIWRTSLNHLQEISPSIQEFISTGVFSALCGDDAGTRLKKVLVKTAYDNTLDFIVTQNPTYLDFSKGIPKGTNISLIKQQKTSIDTLMKKNHFKEILTPVQYEVFLTILQWSKEKELQEYWSDSGTFYPVYKDQYSNMNNLISIKKNGTLQIQLKYIFNKPPFNNPEKRIEFINRLNRIDGVDIRENQIGILPSFPLIILTDSMNLSKFFESLDWVLSELRVNNDIVSKNLEQ